MLRNKLLFDISRSKHFVNTFAEVLIALQNKFQNKKREKTFKKRFMCILSKICLNSVPSKLVLAKIEIFIITILNNVPMHSHDNMIFILNWWISIEITMLNILDQTIKYEFVASECSHNFQNLKFGSCQIFIK